MWRQPLALAQLLRVIDLAANMSTSDGVVATTTPYAWTDGRLVLDGAPVHIVFFEGYEDKPWFKAKPVHNFLGCTTVAQTLARVHEDDKASLKDLAHCYGPPRVGVSDTPTPNPEDYHEGKAIYVNESGLYAMIMGSTKPGAKAFQRWVTSEVLPSIRRTGRYELAAATTENTAIVQQVQTFLQQQAQQMQEVQNALQQVQQGMQQLQLQVQQHLATHYAVHETTRNYAATSREQEYLRTHGRNPAQEPQAFADDGPLEITRFIENKLPQHQHYVIVHFKGAFCREVKRRRLDDYESTGKRFWVAYSQTEYRLAYTEADRDLMDEVWAEEETRQYLGRQLESHRPAAALSRSGRAAQRGPRRRHGPYAHPVCGGTRHVSQRNLDCFFGGSRRVFEAGEE